MLFFLLNVNGKVIIIRFDLYAPPPPPTHTAG